MNNFAFFAFQISFLLAILPYTLFLTLTLTMASSVTDASFQTEVLESPLPVLVDFWAPWCGPCKMMGPIVDELATEYEGKAKIVKVNVDENPEVPGRFNIMSIPTFIIFKDGKPLSSFIGAKPKESVKQELDRAIA